MAFRLGDLLVQRGVITDAQREQILSFQRLHGRPFGLLAEQMFGVCPNIVEAAWAEQFGRFAERVDGTDLIPDALVDGLIDRRQAWQFGCLPLRFEGDEVVVATSTERLARAMRFAGWRIPRNCRFVLATDEALRAALAQHFPLDGAEAAFVGRLRLA